MTSLKIILSICVLIASYLLYNIFDLIYPWKYPLPYNNEICEHLEGFPGVEDLVRFEEFVIGGSNDNFKLFELSTASESPDGSLVYVNTLSEKLKLAKLEVHKFPSGISFHPHGIYLKNNLLYVINHAYSKGGERVEVFEIFKNEKNELHGNYLRSIVLPSYLMGITNDLIVVGNHDEILITSYLPFPDQVEGRDLSLFKKIVNILIWSFKFPMTHVYYCKNSKCEKVMSTNSIMNNGITFDEKNKKVYVVQVFERRLRVFNLNLMKTQDDKILDYDRDILLPYNVDNVEFDKENGCITAGAYVKLIEHQKIINYLRNGKKPDGLYSGSIIIYPNKNDKIENLLINNRTFYGVSSAIMINGSAFHGSWFDDGMLVCKIK